MPTVEPTSPTVKAPAVVVVVVAVVVSPVVTEFEAVGPTLLESGTVVVVASVAALLTGAVVRL
jgi:hypothetical protein